MSGPRFSLPQPDNTDPLSDPFQTFRFKFDYEPSELRLSNPSLEDFNTAFAHLGLTLSARLMEHLLAAGKGAALDLGLLLEEAASASAAVTIEERRWFEWTDNGPNATRSIVISHPLPDPDEAETAESPPRKGEQMNVQLIPGEEDGSIEVIVAWENEDLACDLLKARERWRDFDSLLESFGRNKVPWDMKGVEPLPQETPSDPIFRYENLQIAAYEVPSQIVIAYTEESSGSSLPAGQKGAEIDSDTYEETSYEGDSDLNVGSENDSDYFSEGDVIEEGDDELPQPGESIEVQDPTPQQLARICNLASLSGLEPFFRHALRVVQGLEELAPEKISVLAMHGQRLCLSERTQYYIDDGLDILRLVTLDDVKNDRCQVLTLELEPRELSEDGNAIHTSATFTWEDLRNQFSKRVWATILREAGYRRRGGK